MSVHSQADFSSVSTGSGFNLRLKPQIKKIGRFNRSHQITSKKIKLKAIKRRTSISNGKVILGATNAITKIEFIGNPLVAALSRDYERQKYYL
jgi:hypothetical protein